MVEVDPGTNHEGTSQGAISNLNFGYAQIDGSTTMLSGGNPIANTGISGPYTIGNLIIPITTSSRRTVQQLKLRASNVVGTSSYINNATKVQVHTASQSGIVETAIPVSDSLGSTHNDDGVRIFDFASSTADNPTYNGSTNFYTSNLYSEGSDPGVSGTKEATIRLGVLKHDTTDYSTGFLPFVLIEVEILELSTLRLLSEDKLLQTSHSVLLVLVLLACGLLHQEQQ